MESMDTSEPFNVRNAHARQQQHITGSQNEDGCKKMGNEGKMTAVHEEMNRMNKLPQNSSYVTHRLRVLNKIKELLSIKRTISQDEELELLFAGLSL